MKKIFSEKENVAVLIEGQWMDATVIGRNEYGGVTFYTVELLNGEIRNCKQSEDPKRNEIESTEDRTEIKKKISDKNAEKAFVNRTSSILGMRF